LVKQPNKLGTSVEKISTKHLHRRGSAGRFYYADGFGHRVTAAQVLKYIAGLAIPPAWSEVQISLAKQGKVLVTGIDAAGRKQYIYNPAYRARQDRLKFDRIHAFANALPMMRRITGEHLRGRRLGRDKVMACMVRLIDQAYFRVGNERYAEENHTYGLTTLRSRHLKIEGDKLIFHYTGKSHQDQVREVEDARLAKIVAELDHLPGYEVFKYYDKQGKLVDVRSDDLNAYIKEVMGYDFSAKDFRTWAGTLIAAVALAEIGEGASPTAAKRNVAAAVRTVAEKLGNTLAIARASYIDPRIIDHYLSGQTIKSYLKRIDYYLKRSEHELLGAAEIAVLKLLKRKLKARAVPKLLKR
jgi:DNA topoisomerase-1